MSSTPDNAIEVRGLQKSYKSQTALHGLSFAVPRGSLCGFIGLNGAGKTTTLKILMEMLRADAGEAKVLGHTVGQNGAGLAIRQKTGFLPEGKKLFPYMTVAELIAFLRPFYPTWRADREEHLMRLFELPAQRKTSDLSKGMLAKLQLLLSLSRGAELIILDEPTDGLDAIAVEQVLQELATQVSEEAATVLFCSHRLEEIEQIADHLVIIHEGRCLLDEPIDQLRASSRRFRAVFPAPLAGLERLTPLGAVRQEGRSVSLTVWRNPEAAEAELRELGATVVESDLLSLRQLFVDMVKTTKGSSHAVA